jgi:hypothetical protein
MSRGLKRQQLAILSMPLSCVSVMQAHAATITVNNTNDNGPLTAGASKCGAERGSECRRLEEELGF